MGYQPVKALDSRFPSGQCTWCGKHIEHINGQYVHARYRYAAGGYHRRLETKLRCHPRWQFWKVDVATPDWTTMMQIRDHYPVFYSANWQPTILIQEDDYPW